MYSSVREFRKTVLRVIGVFAFIGVVTVFEHYINSYWPPQHVMVVSYTSTLPAPTPVPTPAPQPLTLEQQFQPWAIKLCYAFAHDGMFTHDVVQRVEIEDNKTTAEVYCMEASDHEVFGPYEVGL